MKRKALLINDKGEHYDAFVTLYRGIDRKECENLIMQHMNASGLESKIVKCKLQ